MTWKITAIERHRSHRIRPDCSPHSICCQAFNRQIDQNHSHFRHTSPRHHPRCHQHRTQITIHSRPNQMQIRTRPLQAATHRYQIMSIEMDRKHTRYRSMQMVMAPLWATSMTTTQTVQRIRQIHLNEPHWTRCCHSQLLFAVLSLHRA